MCGLAEGGEEGGGEGGEEEEAEGRAVPVQDVAQSLLSGPTVDRRALLPRHHVGRVVEQVDVDQVEGTGEEAERGGRGIEEGDGARRGERERKHEQADLQLPCGTVTLIQNSKPNKLIYYNIHLQGGKGKRIISNWKPIYSNRPLVFTAD